MECSEDAQKIQGDHLGDIQGDQVASKEIYGDKIHDDQLDKGLRQDQHQDHKPWSITTSTSQTTTKESQSHTKITAGENGLLQRVNTASSTALQGGGLEGGNESRRGEWRVIQTWQFNRLIVSIKFLSKCIFGAATIYKEVSNKNYLLAHNESMFEKD